MSFDGDSRARWILSISDSRDPETETGSFEIEKRVHGIHGTLEIGLHRMPRSLVVVTRGVSGLSNKNNDTTFLVFQAFQGDVLGRKHDCVPS